MSILLSFKKSTRPNKKYMIILEDPKRTIHFGAKNSKTFVESGSEEKKKNYIKRHRVNEDWRRVNPGSLSRFILWGQSKDIEQNLKDYLKRFKIKDARKIPKQYVADLKGDEKIEQIESILEGKKRPKTSFKSKRSDHVRKFEEKYKTKISDFDFIEKNILKKEGIKQILNKGIAAFYSSGSRPNQTPTSWSRARLASVIMNGKAREIDKKIWEKYKI